MPADDMPAAEVAVDDALVLGLLEAQHPDLAALRLRHVATGWDNEVFRLGDDLCVRVPRRALGGALVLHEHRWLPTLAARLPLPVPVPVRTGSPTSCYPWAWSVCPWFDGATAAVHPPDDPVAAAHALGGFVAALHQPAPSDAPVNEWRGVPLGARTAPLEAAVARLGDTLPDAGRLLDRWAAVVGVPAWSGPPVWLHGDLHPANVVVRDGAVRAVLDFGDLTSGDPATDLAVAWMLFDAETRAVFREAAAPGGVDGDTWARSRGWALALGVAMVAGSADHPVIAAVGRATLAAVVSEPG